MTKPKKTEYMSALDYLYKELNRLVEKIEISSRGKTSKRDLLIYCLIIIFILSVRFGGVIGAFTFILAVATIWNISITQGLLKQSKEAFKQSKTAFENDVFRRMIFSILQLDAQLIAATVSNRSPQLLALALGMLGSLKKSDSLIYERIEGIVKELWPQKKQALSKQAPAISILKQAIEEINKKQVENDKTKQEGE